MPERTTEPTAEVNAKWLLIMERLQVNDLAAWLRTYRTGSRATNENWRSWDSIARRIWEETRVTVTANGLRARWSDEVDAVDAGIDLSVITTREQAERAGVTAAWERARGTGAPEGPTLASDAVGPTGTEAGEHTP